MRITLYTVEEANQLLVELRPRLERVLGMKREFDKLETSFVPLADRAAGVYRVCPVDRGHLREDWPALMEFFEKQVFGKTAGAPKGGWIAQFDSFALAEALLRKVVERSGGHQGLRGTVAIPPLTPTEGMKRWDVRSSRVIAG